MHITNITFEKNITYQNDESEMAGFTQEKKHGVPYLCNSSNHHISNLTVEPAIQENTTQIQLLKILQKQP